MNALSTIVVAEHLLDLQREAELERLAGLALGPEAGRRNAVQRLAGRSARSLSRGFAALAARVDPTQPARSSSNDRERRPIAA